MVAAVGGVAVLVVGGWQRLVNGGAGLFRDWWWQWLVGWRCWLLGGGGWLMVEQLCLVAAALEMMMVAVDRVLHLLFC